SPSFEISAAFSRGHRLDKAIAWLRLSEVLIQGGREDLEALRENAITSFSVENTPYEVSEKMEKIREKIIANPTQKGILKDIQDTLKLLQLEFLHIGPVGSPSPNEAFSAGSFFVDSPLRVFRKRISDDDLSSKCEEK
ncbi:MAG: hypothetical protein JSS09_03815, partial [Verrucomicrobia bacterium]|nr:hypothetical protein [Verrucomicrobiota bacterium]